MDGGQPTVTGAERHLSVLLQVLQEREHFTGVQVSQRQLGNFAPFSLGGKSQEQLPRVTIRAYGVTGEVPLFSHPFMEERMEQRREGM